MGVLAGPVGDPPSGATMSQAIPDNGTVEQIAKQTDGITVEKTVELTEGTIAKAHFELDSAHSDPVEVRLVDGIPEALSPTEVGFHADFHAEHWTIRDDGCVAFEGTVDPASTLETMYGLKLPSREDVEEVGEPPAVEILTEGTDPDDVAAAVEQVETDDGDPERETVDTDGGAREAASESGAAADPRESGAEADGTVPAADGDVPGDVVAALVSELEAGDAGAAQRRALREALGFETPNTFEARLRHVQEAVDDLVAYREALEAFIDENGTARQIVTELREEQAAVRQECDELEATLAALDGRVDDCADRERVADLAASVESVDEELATLREEHEATAARLDERLDDLRSSLHGDVEERLDDLEATLRADVSEVRADVSELRADVEGLHDDVEEGQEWRRSVRAAFGEE
jgi:predicted  nucleic acid-binding Zn-ribbon protein